MNDDREYIGIGGHEIPIASQEELAELLDGAEIVTPQFERSKDEPTPHPAPLDWKSLRVASTIALQELGLRRWNEPDGDDWPHPGVVLWLFPGEWYKAIPDGLSIMDIFGNTETFRQGETDDDIRFGALPYGIPRRAVGKIKEEQDVG